MTNNITERVKCVYFSALSQKVLIFSIKLTLVESLTHDYLINDDKSVFISYCLELFNFLLNEFFSYWQEYLYSLVIILFNFREKAFISQYHFLLTQSICFDRLNVFNKFGPSIHKNFFSFKFFDEQFNRL